MKKIFVVDDDESVLFLSKAILSASHYSVITESDSSQVIDTIKSEMPDLILTDIMMPDINGAELAYNLKHDEQTSNIPIIAVSANPLIDEKTRAYFQEIVMKPYKTEELLGTIKSILGE